MNARNIQRAPHMVFAVTWLGLMAATITAGIIGVAYPWLALGVGLAVLLAEVIAVAYPGELRTTLSEITTYYNRVLSRHSRPGRGWNTLVAIQAVAIGRLFYVVVVGFGTAEAQFFGLVGGVLLAIGQHDHWLDPPTHG